MKTAIIDGCTGQDGSYLAKFLVKHNYHVVGLKRRTSLIYTPRIDPIYNHPNFDLEYFDLDDTSSIYGLLLKYKPDEYYHLAAQSHVRISFDIPQYTAHTGCIGTLHILDAIRQVSPHTRFYNAASSEMFGNSPPPQNENTPFDPQSPYACAKAFSYHITKNYRNSYNLFASNGILFNHESPLRDDNFVSKKICDGVKRIATSLNLDMPFEPLVLGNLDAKRDWGYAGDYVKAMYLMLQYDEPDDFVICTGESHTVREFCNVAFKSKGINLLWYSKGIDEIAVIDTNDADQHFGLKNLGKTVIKLDKKYFRPSEVNHLQGDCSKAKNLLNWEPQIKFSDLIHKMMEDLE